MVQDEPLKLPAVGALENGVNGHEAHDVVLVSHPPSSAPPDVRAPRRCRMEEPDTEVVPSTRQPVAPTSPNTGRPRPRGLSQEEDNEAPLPQEGKGASLRRQCTEAMLTGIYDDVVRSLRFDDVKPKVRGVTLDEEVSKRDSKKVHVTTTVKISAKDLEDEDDEEVRGQSATMEIPDDDEFIPKVKRTATVIVQPEGMEGDEETSRTMQMSGALKRHAENQAASREKQRAFTKRKSSNRISLTFEHLTVVDANREGACASPVPKEDTEALSPLHETMTKKKVDMKVLRDKLEEMVGVYPNGDHLTMPLDPSQGLPTPLFYGVGMKQPQVVKLLIEFRADVRKGFDQEKMWSGIKKGETALSATLSRKARFKGTMLEAKLQEIADALQEEEDRLRGWTKQRIGNFNQEEKAGKEETEEAISIEDQAEIANDEDDAGGNNDVADQRNNYTAKSGIVCTHTRGRPEDHNYDIDVQKLGEGTFGHVRKAVHMTSRQARALKAVPRRLVEESGLWVEIEIMRLIDHPNVVRLYETFEDERSVYMVTELCTGGELFDRLVDEGSFSEKTSAKLMSQILGAISYLHNHNICHRDLKPENFLLKDERPIEEAIVKIIDFGTSKEFGEEAHQEMRTKICTLHYVAPEILSKKENPYTEKCDVWSVGVILFLLLCGSPPFYGETDIEVLKKIRKGQYAFRPVKVWEHVSGEAKDLVSKMLVVKPKQRFSAEDAVMHPWVTRLAPNAVDTCFSGELVGNLRSFRAQNRLKKAAVQMIAQSLSDDSLEGLRQLFFAFDTKREGSLKIAQIEEAIQNSGAPIESKEELTSLLWEMDHGSGKVNYTHFLAATMDRQKYLQEEALKTAFQVFDLDGNGKITKEELFQVLSGEVVAESNFNSSLQGAGVCDLESIEQIIKDVDIDGDGEIDFEEFRIMMARK